MLRSARSMFSLGQSRSGSISGFGLKLHILCGNDFSQKSLRKLFGIFQQSLLKMEKFENAVVIHFAIVVLAARHDFDGSNSIEICGKPR